MKTGVFAPDWRDRERVEYTRRLIRIAAALLPEGVEGGISTVPLSYKPWIAADAAAVMTSIVRHLAEIAAGLVREHRRSGRRLRLDIEPEPDGLVETSTELVAFYRDWLLPVGAPLLAAELGTSPLDAERLILEHLCVCYDTCHLAIAYEDPVAALAAFAAAGIRVGRVQLSAALQVSLPVPRIETVLAAFDDGVYLPIRQAAPRGVDVSVVADGLGQVARRPGHEKHRRVGRVAVAAAVLREQAERPAHASSSNCVPRASPPISDATISAPASPCFARLANTPRSEAANRTDEP